MVAAGARVSLFRGHAANAALVVLLADWGAPGPDRAWATDYESIEREQRKADVFGESDWDKSAVRETLRGIMFGLDPHQTASQVEECREIVKKAGGPLQEFVQEVARACLTNEAECIPTLSEQSVLLGNVSTSGSDIIDACPKHIRVLFSAAYDPLLPINIMAMAILHNTFVHLHIEMVLRFLAEHKYYEAGFEIGEVITTIVPLVRLPLTTDDVHMAIAGFAYSFMSSEEQSAQTNDTDLVALPASAANSTNMYQSCVNYVYEKFDPISETVFDLTLGSFLNYTCYKQIVLINPGPCLGRAWNGLSTLHLAAGAAIQLVPELSDSTIACPAKFGDAIRQLRSRSNVTIEIASNLFGHLGNMDTIAEKAADDFFRNNMYKFGTHVGELLQRSIKPEFYHYEVIHFEFATAGFTMQCLLLAMVCLGSAVCAFCPLLLFCSARNGWHPPQEEITVVCRDRNAEFDLAYNFFGTKMKAGSEIEFVVECEAQQEEVADDSNEETDDPVDEASPTWLCDCMPRSSEKFLFKSTATDCGDDGAWDLFRRTSYCVRMTLTEEAEPRSCRMNVLWSIIGLILPCFAGGPRRWKRQTFSKRMGRWIEVAAPDTLTQQVHAWTAQQLASLQDGLRPLIRDAASSEYSSLGSSSDCEAGSASSPRSATQRPQQPPRAREMSNMLAVPDVISSPTARGVAISDAHALPDSARLTRGSFEPRRLHRDASHLAAPEARVGPPSPRSDALTASHGEGGRTRGRRETRRLHRTGLHGAPPEADVLPPFPRAVAQDGVAPLELSASERIREVPGDIWGAVSRTMHGFTQEPSPRTISSSGHGLELTHDSCVTTRMYLNSQVVRPPILDKPTDTKFSVLKIRSGILRIRPQHSGKECWDVLLFICAGAQLFASCWQMLFIVVANLWNVLAGGEILTLWFFWGQAAAAALLIHKKLHARWYARVSIKHEVTQRQVVDHCMLTFRVFRTPSLVPLLYRAPSLRSSVPPPIPWLYRPRYDLEEGDLVRITSLWSPLRGKTGALLSAEPDVEGMLLVAIDDTRHRFKADAVDLADREGRARRPPIWEDRLFGLLAGSTKALMISSIVCLLCFSSVMSDDNGELTLHLSDSCEGYHSFDPLCGYLLGTYTSTLVTCVGVELFLRFLEHIVSLLLQGAIYR